MAAAAVSHFGFERKLFVHLEHQFRLHRSACKHEVGDASFRIHHNRSRQLTRRFDQRQQDFQLSFDGIILLLGSFVRRSNNFCIFGKKIREEERDDKGGETSEFD